MPTSPAEKKPYYIVAGNYQEYLNHVNTHQFYLQSDKKIGQVIYLDYVGMLKGAKKILDPDGIFVGTWNKRTDIKDIVLELFALTLDSKKCDILTKVYNSL
jgi:hypothetical protein